MGFSPVKYGLFAATIVQGVLALYQRSGKTESRLGIRSSKQI